MMENELFLFFFAIILLLYFFFILLPPPPSSSSNFSHYFFILGCSSLALFVCLWCRQKQKLDFHFPLFSFAKPPLFHLMACTVSFTNELNESREIFSTPCKENKYKRHQHDASCV